MEKYRYSSLTLSCVLCEAQCMESISQVPATVNQSRSWRRLS